MASTSRNAGFRGASPKPLLNIVIGGGPKSGAPYLYLQTKYKYGAKMIEEVGGKEKLQYAWVLDKLKADPDLRIALFDKPGYDALLVFSVTNKRMNASVWNIPLDIFIYVIDPTKEDWETSDVVLDHDLQDALTLGVEQLIVGVNYMSHIEFNELRFEAVKETVTSYIKKIGYNPDAVQVIPMDASAKHNIHRVSDEMPWFKQHFFGALDAILPPVPRVGSIIKPVEDMAAIFAPVNLITEVKSVEMHHEALQETVPGDNVGVVKRKSKVAGLMPPPSHPIKKQRKASLKATVLPDDEDEDIFAGSDPDDVDYEASADDLESDDSDSSLQSLCLTSNVLEEYKNNGGGGNTTKEVSKGKNKDDSKVKYKGRKRSGLEIALERNNQGRTFVDPVDYVMHMEHIQGQFTPPPGQTYSLRQKPGVKTASRFVGFCHACYSFFSASSPEAVRKHFNSSYHTTLVANKLYLEQHEAEFLKF